jgi:hypothetical protein
MQIKVVVLQAQEEGKVDGKVNIRPKILQRV